MNYQDFTDEQLRHFYWQAEEMEDGKAIQALKKEWNRRNAND